MITLDILAFGAHPDDVEIGMAGTLAKHTRSGFAVGICDLTQAEMSSNGTVTLRQAEAKRAGEILQLTIRDNLCLPDRGLEVSKEHIQAVVVTIRYYRPRIICIPYWEDRHPDHIRCSHIVQEAIFNTKLRHYMPHLPAHTVEYVFFYFINDIITPSFVMDISTVYEEKKKTLACYESQFMKSTDNYVNTPLNQCYIERTIARDMLLGQPHGFAYAEGFITKQPYAISLFL